MLKRNLIKCWMLSLLGLGIVGCHTAPRLPASCTLKHKGHSWAGYCAMYARNLEGDLLLNGVEARRVDYVWGEGISHAVVLFKDQRGKWWLMDNELPRPRRVRSEFDYCRIREVYPHITQLATGIFSTKKNLQKEMRTLKFP